MKVYISKYPDSWWTSSIHRKYMNNKYNYDWKESTTTFEKFLEKLEDCLQWIYSHSVNHIVKHRKRKIKVRIDPSDTWSMDNTLAHIVLPMLKQLRDTKHGSPIVDKEDLPKELLLSKREQKVFDRGSYDKKVKATQEEIDAVNEKFHLQWLWVIDQMIWSFEQELDEEDGDISQNFYDPYSPNEVISPRKTNVVNSDGTVVEKDWLFWNEEEERKRGKFNKEKYDAYHKRKQLGFTLFGKYYQSLWD